MSKQNTKGNNIATNARKTKIKLFSKGIRPNQTIPRKFICQNQGGKDLSPDLSWKPIKGAESYVILAFDPDAPSGTWFHWIVPYIPSTITKVPILPARENKILEVRGEKLVQGKNSWGKYGYGGPCPSPGKPHRYYFVVYALDKRMENSNVNKVQSFLTQIQPHVIGYGHLKAIYQRN